MATLRRPLAVETGWLVWAAATSSNTFVAAIPSLPFQLYLAAAPTKGWSNPAATRDAAGALQSKRVTAQPLL